MNIIDYNSIYDSTILIFIIIFALVTTLLGFQVVQLFSKYFNIGQIFAQDLKNMVNEIQCRYLSIMTIKEYFKFILLVTFILGLSIFYMFLLCIVLVLIIQWR